MRTLGRMICLIVFAAAINLSASEKNIKVTLTNSINLERMNELVSINVKKLEKSHPDFLLDSFIISDGEKEVPYQVEKDGNETLISFVIDFKPMEKKEITIKYGSDYLTKPEFTSKTYAGLSRKVDYDFKNGVYLNGRFENVKEFSVPKTHVDHDKLFQCEGPVWESELVGYRFYLDWRNAIDIFGKKKDGLFLKDVGRNDIDTIEDSYHHMQDWGMDIFKVGSSLGIGSIAMWDGGKVNMIFKTDSIFCEIAENGPVKSAVRTEYYGWLVGHKKYNLFSELSIAAGSRFTKHSVRNDDGAENLVTGLAKEKNGEFFKKNNKNGWSYIAVYGKQTLNDDNLGIAVVYNEDNFLHELEDNLSYVVELKPINKKISYYFCAAWELEPNGIKSKEAFQKYLDESVEKFDNSITIQVE